MDLSAEDETALRDKLALARNMGSHTEILDGKTGRHPADYAQTHGITQLFIGHSQRRRSLMRFDPVDLLIRRTQGMDIRIFLSNQG